MSDQKTVCTHSKIPEPNFDLDQAKKMESVEQIRAAFPRTVSMCPDCKRSVIKYASYEHYIFGDY